MAQTKPLMYAEVGEYNADTNSWLVDGYFTEDNDETPTPVGEIMLDGSLRCLYGDLTPENDMEFKLVLNSFHSEDYINNEQSEYEKFERYMLWLYKDLRYSNASDYGEFNVYNPDGVCCYEIAKTRLGEKYIYAFRLAETEDWNMMILRDDNDKLLCETIISRLYEDIVSAVGELFRIDLR